LSLYISEDEITTHDLRELVNKSYSTFRHPQITPLHKFNDKFFVLELFHGPTFAFKDVALQLLGNLFEFFLKRRNALKPPDQRPEKLTVVGATSGDTGRHVQCICYTAFSLTCNSAAIYGLRNKANIDIFILHPKGRVSPIQEAQMTTVTDANVHNVAVEGTFDDCQVRVIVFSICRACHPIALSLGYCKIALRRSSFQRKASTWCCKFYKLGTHPRANCVLFCGILPCASSITI
jgi:threonine synthase